MTATAAGVPVGLEINAKPTSKPRPTRRRTDTWPRSTTARAIAAQPVSSPQDASGRNSPMTVLSIGTAISGHSTATRVSDGR